jgi:hypothetical protein
MSAINRFCSLIPGFGVKLSAIILAGAHCSPRGRPHDGVRRCWWINGASAVSLIESSQKIGRSHHRHRPSRDIFSRRAAGTFGLVIARYAATSFFDQLNSVRSIHMRCRMTASLRATATVAFRSPFRLASLIPQAFSPDHFGTRVSNTPAASKSNCVAWRHHTSRGVVSSFPPPDARAPRAAMPLLRRRAA